MKCKHLKNAQKQKWSIQNAAQLKCTARAVAYLAVSNQHETSQAIDLSVGAAGSPGPLKLRRATK